MDYPVGMFGRHAHMTLCGEGGVIIGGLRGVVIGGLRGVVIGGLRGLTAHSYRGEGWCWKSSPHLMW